LIAGIVASTILFLWCRHVPSFRTLAVVLLCTFGVLALAMMAQQGPAQWLTGDGAIIELYTIHATRGVQRLGAYSQYGWHHPGPAFFYLLAPLYVLGGRGASALSAGALAINGISVIVIGWVVRRKTDASVLLATAVCVALLVYCARVPLLLTSAWNPHIPVLSLAALIIVSAALCSGHIGLLPVAVALGSFIMQAHVGLVPVAAGVLFAAVVSLVIQVRHIGQWREFWTWVNVSAWVLVGFWLLPVAEQLMESPGNLSQLWRFFILDDRSGQAVTVSWRAWGDMLAGVFRPDFYLALGGRLIPSSGISSPILATCVVTTLPVVAVRAWQTHQRFHSALALVCLLASLTGFWSALHIERQVIDHEVFWLSAVGVLNVAVTFAAVPLFTAAVTTSHPPRSGFVVTTVVVLWAAGTATLGSVTLINAERKNAHDPLREELMVRSLTEQTFTSLRQLGVEKPLLRVDGDSWEIGAGLVVQFVKAGHSVAVDNATLFDRPWLATGSEDAVVTICGPALHRQLVIRSGNFVAAESPSIFLDGIKIVRAELR
jgi:hypothetical protein